MKRLLHISDLHFGRLHTPALEALRLFIREQENPFDLIVVTGDWTQRARRHQFRAAREFVLELNAPVLGVPGNHDVPLYDVWTRFFRPFKRYQHYILPHGLTVFKDPEVVVVGVSTVNIFSIQEGTVHREEMERAKEEFLGAESGTLKVLACHHGLPEKEREILGADIVLSGHTHNSFVERGAYANGGVHLTIQSGTTVSARWREEVNSFHVLAIEEREVSVETFDLGESGFVAREMRPVAFHLPLIQ